MKRILLSFIFIAVGFSNGISQVAVQKIDSTNYYDFFASGKSIMWLEEESVVKIITEELRYLGYETMFPHSLVKLDSSKYFVATVFCRELNASFLYIQTHTYPPSKNYRALRSSDRKDMGYDFIQMVETNEGPKFIKIKDLPQNVIILNEDCYWYQSLGNDNKLVSRSNIEKILRQDIRTKIKKMLELNVKKN